MPRHRILIVDDDQDLRETIQHFFARTIPELEAETAASAEIALIRIGAAASEGRAFDVVLTDHQMGRMTGLELLQKLKDRDDPARRILMTADATAQDAAVDHPAVDLLLAKPFSPRTLGERVAKMLEPAPEE